MTESVAPAELEALLMTHPATLMRPSSADLMNTRASYPWLKKAQRVDAEALKARFAERVASHKRLADVCRGCIPRNPGEKPLRRVLRARDAERMETWGCQRSRDVPGALRSICRVA